MLEAESLEIIEKWFADDEDGEFLCQSFEVPYTLIGPKDSNSHVLFTTKPGSVAAMVAKDCSKSFALIGRSGLPNQHDPYWIAQLVEKRQILFLGDMDPVDLMVFAWLRMRLNGIAVRHLGVNDLLLQRLLIRLPPSFLMPCASSEVLSLSVLKTVIPDLQDILGPECMKLLNEGKKIELEAVVGALDSHSDLLSSEIIGGF